MQKKYIFFDYDGTLTGNIPGVVPKNTYNCIQNLKKNGHELFVATGRLQCSARAVSNKLNIKTFVSDGGNSVTMDGDIVYMDPLRYDKILPLLKFLDNNKIPWAGHIDNTNVIHTKYDFKNIHSIDNLSVYYNDEINNYTNFYKLFIQCIDNIDKHIDNLGIKYLKYDNSNIIIEPMEKQKGIKYILDKLNVKDEDVFVFGDGKNDINMFCDKWTCIAMGNGNKDLKEKADFVTLPCYEDGITYACKKFSLI